MDVRRSGDKCVSAPSAVSAAAALLSLVGSKSPRGSSTPETRSLIANWRTTDATSQAVEYTEGLGLHRLYQATTLPLDQIQCFCQILMSSILHGRRLHKD
jgi:hypothetical protein